MSPKSERSPHIEGTKGCWNHFLAVLLCIALAGCACLVYELISLRCELSKVEGVVNNLQIRLDEATSLPKQNVHASTSSKQKGEPNLLVS